MIKTEKLTPSTTQKETTEKCLYKSIERNISPLFWNPFYLLTRKADIHFAIGVRGAGKSFATFNIYGYQYVYEKLGKRILYVRRHQNEVDIAKKEFIPKVYGHYVKGARIYTKNDEHIGYALALSTAHKFKSSDFTDVGVILFDEFIPDNAMYIKDEYITFLNLVHTVCRHRDDVKIILVANGSQFDNPYFNNLKLSMPELGKVKVYNSYLPTFESDETGHLIRTSVKIAVEFVDLRRELEQIYKKSPAYKLSLTSPQFYQYAFQGRFYDYSAQVVPWSKNNDNLKYQYTLVYGGNLIDVYINSKKRYYFTNNHEKNIKKYPLTKQDADNLGVYYDRKLVNFIQYNHRQILSSQTIYETNEVKNFLFEAFKSISYA